MVGGGNYLLALGDSFHLDDAARPAFGVGAPLRVLFGEAALLSLPLRSACDSAAVAGRPPYLSVRMPVGRARRARRFVA